MDEKSSKLLNILISCGIALFAIGCVFYSLSMKKNAIDILFVVLVCFQLIIGSIICTLAAIRTQKALHMFIGAILVFGGTLTLLIRHVLPFTISQWWPVYGIIAGVMLFGSGLFKYHKIKFGYCMPAVTLFLMGIWYALFSFNVIKVSFVSIAATVGPVFMLLIAVVLVVYFLLQQRHKELIVTDEDTGIFADEDPVLPKNE